MYVLDIFVILGMKQFLQYLMTICPNICFVVFYSTMFTASTDKTLGIWDYETGTRIKKLKGHSSFVNSCFPSRRGPQYIVSGADDCTVKVGCSSGLSPSF